MPLCTAWRCLFATAVWFGMRRSPGWREICRCSISDAHAMHGCTRRAASVARGGALDLRHGDAHARRRISDAALLLLLKALGDALHHARGVARLEALPARARRVRTAGRASHRAPRGHLGRSGAQRPLVRLCRADG